MRPCFRRTGATAQHGRIPVAKGEEESRQGKFQAKPESKISLNQNCGKL
jgi:hypothetical protein